MLEQEEAAPFPSQDLWKEIQEHLVGKVGKQDRVMLFLDNKAPDQIQVGVFHPQETQEATIKRMEQCVSRSEAGAGIQYHLPV